MSSTTPLTDAINALITRANSITGASDVTLNSAVENLINGYDGVEELTIILDLNPSFLNIIFPSWVKTLNLKSSFFSSPSRSLGRLPTWILATNNVEVINFNYGNHKPLSVADSLRGDSYQHLKTINLNVDTSQVGGWDRFLYGNCSNENGIEIKGIPLNFSSLSNWYNVLNLKGIKEIRFAEETLSVSPTIDAIYNETYSNDTWISFANCLVTDANGTVTIGNTAQSKLATIVGTVTNGTFVEDENGTITLANFITNIKNWTLA